MLFNSRALVYLFLTFLPGNIIAGNMTSVYKLDDAVAREQFASEKLEVIGLGLSSKQIKNIKAITKGKVDFSGFYKITHDVRDRKEYRNLPGFDSSILPNIPPPATVEPSPDEPSTIEPDPLQKESWWLKGINLANSWEIATGKGVTIADCDAGYYTDESDLLPNLVMEHVYDLADKDDPFVINDGFYRSLNSFQTYSFEMLKSDSRTAKESVLLDDCRAHTPNV